MKISTAITDLDLINKLPDTSIISYFNADDLTSDKIKDMLSQKITRKKLQYLFNYKFDTDIKNKLTSILMRKFEEELKESSSGSADGDVKEDSKNHIVIKNNTVYEFEVFSIGNALFQIDNFNKLFFTKDMIDYVFGLNDKDFIISMMSIVSFWNELINADDVYNHLKTNYSDYFIEAYKNIEVAFVKIITKESGLLSDSYDNILDLINDDTAIIIIDNSDAKSIYNNSIFGGIVNLFNGLKINYNLYSDNVDNIANAIKSISNKSQYELAENPYLLQKISENDNILKNKGADILTYLLNDDMSLGKMILEMSGKNEKVTFTQLLNTSSYKQYIISAVTSGEADVLFNKTGLLLNQNLYNKYIEVIDSITKLSARPMCKNAPDNNKIYFYVLNNGKVQYYALTFPDATSDKFKVSVKNINFDRNLAAILSPLEEGKTSVVDASLNAYAEDDKINAAISFLNGKKIFMYDNQGTHIFAIDKNGEMMSNKFICNDTIEISELKDVKVTDSTYSVHTESIVLLGGNIDNINIEELQKTANNNIKDIDKVFALNDKFLALLNSGAIKQITESDLVDCNDISDLEEKDEDGNVTDSAINNGILDIVERIGTLFVLDKENNLWYKDKDGSVKKIANVNAIETIGDGILVKPSDSDDYVLVLFNNKIRKYDYIYNL